MKLESISKARQARLFRQPGSADALPDFLQLPPWWLGSSEEYRPIHDARHEIHQHDRIMAKKALTMMMGSVSAAVVVYSVDALGASAGSAGSGAVLAAAVFLLVLTGIWILDRRLAQQFRDAKLQALVWQELVTAVRHGRIDLPAIETGPQFETEVEGLLRRELAVVAQYLASQENLELHLPLFEEGVTLTRA